MDCSICKDLEKEVETREREFAEARCSASYGVCIRPAAYRNVNMEFARSALQDHQSVCATVVRKPTLRASGLAFQDRRSAAA
jgi:hypothetical protein